MLLDKDILDKMVESGYVLKNKHDLYDLFIYNYSNKTQYDKYWNETTMMCRGLILDKDYNIISRPFKKFFNIEELNRDDVPKLPFEVFEKLDGSLGILYWANDNPYISTRGSFNSTQANKANEILYGKYQHVFKNLKKDRTYLFEIIFKENKIVIDYDFEDIILLAIIDNETGRDLPLEDVGFKIVNKYDFKDIDTLKSLNFKNKEGFVVKFSNDFRLKIKFEDYLKLHRIITETSNISIWESLKSKKSVDEIFEHIPDEFINSAKLAYNELVNNYTQIEEICKKDFMLFPTRKETAEYFKSKKYTSILFYMLDNRDYSEIIWKLIRPKYKKLFYDKETE